MEKLNNTSNSSKMNFYLNLLNFILFLIVVITGFIIQIGYHMHNLPDDYAISGLARAGWLNFHRISASFFLAGIIAHCLLHRGFISTISDKILRRKPLLPASISYWLFIVSIPTTLVAMVSWIFVSVDDPARFILVEIHDKIILLWIILSIIHIASRANRIIRVYKKLI